MDLYDEIMKVSRCYVGRDTEKFVKRQITAHMQIEVSEMDAKFLDDLAKWCYTSGRMEMDEQKAVDFSEEILKIKEGQV